MAITHLQSFVILGSSENNFHLQMLSSTFPSQILLKSCVHFDHEMCLIEIKTPLCPIWKSFQLFDLSIIIIIPSSLCGDHLIEYLDVYEICWHFIIILSFNIISMWWPLDWIFEFWIKYFDILEYFLCIINIISMWWPLDWIFPSEQLRKVQNWICGVPTWSSEGTWNWTLSSSRSIFYLFILLLYFVFVASSFSLWE